MRIVKMIWLLIVLVPYKIRAFIIKYLLKLRARLQIRSLREAIGEADKDKEQTGRKNMVVFNTVSGKYEPIAKQLLKKASNVQKNKSNKAHTEGRIRMMKKRERVFTPERVKTIEKKSLYVTN